MVLSTSWLLQYIKSLLRLHDPSIEPGALLSKNLWDYRWGKGKEEPGTRLLTPVVETWYHKQITAW
jgi:hypothetical protein